MTEQTEGTKKRGQGWNEFTKLSVLNKEWNLECIFDDPRFDEFKYKGKVIRTAIFNFIDLDTGKQIKTSFGQDAIVTRKLLAKRRGDRFKITYKEFVAENGKSKHYYNIYDLNNAEQLDAREYRERKLIEENKRDWDRDKFGERKRQEETNTYDIPF